MSPSDINPPRSGEGYRGLIKAYRRICVDDAYVS